MKNPCLELARASIDHYLREGKVLALPPDLPDQLVSIRAGAFVTLYKAGALRGCIGTITPVCGSLAEEIIRNAVASAAEDPRFPPVRPEELDKITISVDLLSPAEPVDSPRELDPARYGVIVSAGYRRGLLLPDLEGVDTAGQQLAIALAKAGIQPHEPYRIERFEVTRCEETG